MLAWPADGVLSIPLVRRFLRPRPRTTTMERQSGAWSQGDTLEMLYSLLLMLSHPSEAALAI